MKTLKIKIIKYADRDIAPALSVAKVIFKKHVGAELDLTVEEQNKSEDFFKTLPWYEDREGVYYLVKSWLKKHVFDSEYDISIALFNDEQWRAKYDNKIGGTAEASPINERGLIYMTATEGQKEVLKEGGEEYSELLVRLLHEICHVSFDDFMERPDLDKTHYYHYEKGDLTKALEKIDLSSYTTVTERKNKLKYTISLLKKVVSLYKKLLTDESKDNSIQDLAKAIKKFEGWYPGSLSYRQNNPGNLRYSKYEDDNRNGYSYFNDYETGWKALLYQLRIAVDGRSSVYSPEDTLLDFFKKYAPLSDNNYPENYAKFVANELNVTIDTKISTFKT